MLTHRNLVANTLQCAAWVAPFYDQKAGVVITPLPIYHVYSLTANVLCFIEVGAHNVLITDPRDLPALVKLFRRTRVAYMTAVNTLFNALLNTPGLRRASTSARCASAWAAAWPCNATSRSAGRKSPAFRSPRATASPRRRRVVSGNPLNIKSFNGSVGVPFPSTDVEICDETGRALAPGEVGEICVRGPQVMAGYWGRPEETALVMLDGGWLRTGDVGHIDAAGYIFIEDRKKDVIVVSGFKVYPNEIEDVAAAQRGVREVAADRRAGQAIGRGREAIHRAQRSEAHGGRRDRARRARTSLATRSPATSSSSTSCRRATSARCCAARSKLASDTRQVVSRVGASRDREAGRRDRRRPCRSRG